MVVVGAGPAGIVTALELARSGFDVLLLESGQRWHDPEAQRLSDAAEWDHERHAEMSMAVRRQVGGTSVIWGGRCVPFDPIDFEARSVVPDARWPLGYDELTPYFQRACDWLMCGRAAFDSSELPQLPPSIVPGLPNGDVRSSSFERWSLPTNFGREYRRALDRSRRLRLMIGLTCTRVVVAADGRRVDHLETRGHDGREINVRGKHFVLAAGGLETTRLLLASPRADGPPVGNHSDQLGRWYMGHAEGVIAKVRFTTPPQRTIYAYERDVDGVYVRRRFSFSAEAQQRLELPNIVAWLANPALSDPAHGSGVLSFAYLALASPLGRVFASEAQRESLTGKSVPGSPYGPAEQGSVRAHMRNVIHGAGPASRFVGEFGAGRFFPRRRRLPGFFVYSPANVYPLQYHGEHLPRRDSRVTLAAERDELGMPRLNIDIRFSQADIDGVVRAHRRLDEYLRRHSSGSVEFLNGDPADAVRSTIGGGFHQTGTTRMSERPEDGVLDPGLAVHGLEDLSVVSSSAFPSSGQANSTFMIVVFALRLADRLRAERGR
ncbi:MAG: GMC family oxidoreductase [Actinomycetota bacterium]|nr:GMC family oxidoreductase [Actinomycetota bacterium]